MMGDSVTGDSAACCGMRVRAGAGDGWACAGVRHSSAARVTLLGCVLRRLICGALLQR